MERSLTMALQSLRREPSSDLSVVPESEVAASSTPADLPSGCLAPQDVSARGSSVQSSPQDRERLMQAVLQNHQITQSRRSSVARPAHEYSANSSSHGL